MRTKSRRKDAVRYAFMDKMGEKQRKNIAIGMIAIMVGLSALLVYVMYDLFSLYYELRRDIPAYVVDYIYVFAIAAGILIVVSVYSYAMRLKGE